LDVLTNTVRGFAQSIQANDGMVTSDRSRLPGYSVQSTLYY